MPHDESKKGPILRLFQVQAKPGCADELVRKFSTTSADVVQNEPGNKGYFFGQGVSKDADFVVFASIWDNLDAVKARFGETWQSSFLPPGYEDLIDNCSVQHLDVGTGWHVRLEGPAAT